MEFHCILHVLYLVLTSYVTRAHGAKILSCPFTIYKNSNLRNEEKILSILSDHGHDVYILCDSGYKPPPFLVNAGVKLITYPRPLGLPPSKYTFTLRTLTERFLEEVAMKIMHASLASCESFMNSTDIHTRMKNENFHLVSYFALTYCKYAIQGVLGDIPSVQFMPLDFAWRYEHVEVPLVPSYYPSHMYNMGQVMSFKERVWNHLYVLRSYLIIQKLKYDILRAAGRYKIKCKQPESLGFVFGGFPLEYPAPTPPDLVYLNGILATQTKTLDSETKMFVESSGSDGIIIMSLGSVVSEYDEYYGNLIAEVFSKLPQKVLWKYEGPTPKTLGNNTRLLKWLPQTGLLAHPKTKLFITHCGQNSMYETVLSGVPVVAIPLFEDQPQNAARLTTTHSTGVYVDLHTMTVQSLHAAITKVISNPVYKENAIKLSRYINDQPIAGKDLLIYWVDYVIRHKDISHLKAYGRLLPWYQFHSLDVLIFIAFVVFIMCFICFKCFMCICLCFCSNRGTKTKTE